MVRFCQINQQFHCLFWGRKTEDIRTHLNCFIYSSLMQFLDNKFTVIRWKVKMKPEQTDNYATAMSNIEPRKSMENG